MDQLLEAKRSEKPTPRFWDSFDDELRIKQRLLLQQQTVDDPSLESNLWLRFRKLGSLCLATASCGAIGFLAMQSLPHRASDVALSEPSSGPTPSLSLIEEAEFQVAKNAATKIEIETKTETEFFEIAAPETTVLARAMNPEQGETLAGAAEKTGEPTIEGFTLALETPFDSLQIDDSLGGDVKQMLTKRLMERYLHPLSDQGHRYDGYLASASDPLNRISTVAIKTNFLDLDAPKELRLNTLSLRF